MAKEAKEAAKARTEAVLKRNDHGIEQLGRKGRALALDAVECSFDELEAIHRWISLHYADRADELAAKAARELESLTGRASAARKTAPPAPPAPAPTAPASAPQIPEAAAVPAEKTPGAA